MSRAQREDAEFRFHAAVKEFIDAMNGAGAVVSQVRVEVYAHQHLTCHLIVRSTDKSVQQEEAAQ